MEASERRRRSLQGDACGVVQINARDPKSGVTSVVEVSAELSLREALSRVAVASRVSAEDIVLTASSEKLEKGLFVALRRLSKTLSSRRRLRGESNDSSTSEVDGTEKLFYYRNKVRPVNEAMPWYEFLTYTELCRWTFDGFGMSEIEGVKTVMRILQNLRIHSILNKSLRELCGFVYSVSDLMNKNTEYHNFNHVVDVLQCVYLNLVATGLAGSLRPTETVALVLATLCHDLDHPGFSNNFAHNEGLLDGYLSIECRSINLFRRLCHDHGLLDCLAYPEESRVLDCAALIISRTDMRDHATFLDLIISSTTNQNDDNGDPMQDEDRVDVLLCLVLKCADISNQARPWKVARKWNFAVYAEFWREGDADLEKGREVNPLHKRGSESKAEVASKTVNFIKYVVTPLYEAYADYVNMLLSQQERTTTTHATQQNDVCFLQTQPISEALTILANNQANYQLEADGLHVPDVGLLAHDRPGICGSQQLELEETGGFRRRRRR